MVIVIHQTKSTQNAFLYNEKKVEQKVASFFHSRNTKAINPFFYNKSHRLKEFTDIERLNPRIKNKCLHISFNPSTADNLKLTDKTIREEIDAFMKHMGYENQPYFVYKHKDLERVHFHIVSTRIDRQTGKKIKDNHERQKAQNFIKELEQRHQLKNKQFREESVFKFSARSRNIKKSLEDLFRHMNQIDSISSKALYDEALKLVNVEIRKSGRGHIVVVADGEGKVIRYPIRLSKFKEKPIFWINKKEELEQRFLISTDGKLRSSHYSFLKDFFSGLNRKMGYQGLNKDGTKLLKTRKKKRKLRR